MKRSMNEHTDLMLQNLGRLIYSYQPLKVEAELKQSYMLYQPLKIISTDKIVIEVRMPGYTASEVLSEICKNKLSTPFFMLSIYAADVTDKTRLQQPNDYFFARYGQALEVVHTLQALHQSVNPRPNPEKTALHLQQKKAKGKLVNSLTDIDK